MKSATQSAPVVSSDEELLILVDEKDGELGALSKRECHIGDGILHRAFSIFLFNAQGEVLMQRRSPTKTLWPGYWSNACCSHPRDGETVDEAVHRRLAQELGVSTHLEYLYKFVYKAKFGSVGTEHELCWVWAGSAEADQVEENPNEIAEWQFLRPEELDSKMDNSPASFTPWIKLEWKWLKENYLNQEAR